MRHLDLTGDGWLPLHEARKLARWWHFNGWSANLISIGRGRFRVTASKEEVPEPLRPLAKAIGLSGLVIPSLQDLAPYCGTDECTEWAEAVVRAFPDANLVWEAGAYLSRGRYRDHAWASAPDGTIVDTTHGQFDPAVPILIARPGSPEHARYLRAEDMTDEQRVAVYGPA